mgnify:CR=1 FL=1
MSELGYWITTTCLVVVAALNVIIMGVLLMGYMS